jgi:broad specificity phosphatase PhoE
LHRHSIRGEGKDLSPYGLQLAREARRSLQEDYALVLTSAKRRCRQTLEAFGYRRYMIEARLAPMDYAPFAAFEKAIRKLRRKKQLSWIEAAFRMPEAAPALREAAKTAVKVAADIASFLKDGETALVVTHGDVPELAALTVAPSFELKHLGRPLSFCEGVALRFEGDKLVNANVLRLAHPAAKARAPESPAAVPSP